MTKEEHLFARFKQIGYEVKAGAVAIHLLSQSLKQNESVLYLLEGSIQNSLGYLIATDKRVFYAGVDKFKKPVLEHLNYEDLYEIRETEDELIPSIEITIMAKNQNQITIKGCEAEDGVKFVKLLRYLSKGAEA